MLCWHKMLLKLVKCGDSQVLKVGALVVNPRRPYSAPTNGSDGNRKDTNKRAKVPKYCMVGEDCRDSRQVLKGNWQWT
jgi:hypothetical protein